MFSALVITLLAVMGAEYIINPLVMVIILMSSLMPDLDMIGGGGEEHRGAIHSFFFMVLYGLFITIFAAWVAPALEINVIIPVFVVISLLHFLHFYRAERPAAREKYKYTYIGILGISLWLVIDFGGFERIAIVPPAEHIFFAAVMGCLLHLVVDLLNSGGRCGIALFWPFTRKRYGIGKKNIMTIGRGGEMVLFATLTSLTAVCLCFAGQVTSPLLMDFARGNPNTFNALVFVVTVGVFIACLFSTKPRPPEAKIVPGAPFFEGR